MAHETAKLLSLNTFVNLVAPRLIAPEPPAWDRANQGPVPDKRARLKAYAGAYRSAMANPATAHDFPALNTREAWLDSFAAWEKIRMVAHAIERSDAAGTTMTEDETPEEVPFRVLQGDEPVPTEAGVEPAAFAGGASGGAGGGAAFDGGEIGSAMADLSANPPAEVPGLERVGIDELIGSSEPAADPTPLESTPIDPVAEPITEPATFDTPSDQSDR